MRARRVFAVRLFAAVLPALALASCARDTATALDLEVTFSGNIDQIEIQAVTLNGNAVDLQDEARLFPASASGDLRSGDVLTLWFAATDAGKDAAVTAVGRRCGQVVTSAVTTAAQRLVKDATVRADLALGVAATPSCGGGGAGGGAGGRGGAAGASGQGGIAGAGGTGGAAGASGSGGVAGAGGASGGAGAAGRGGAGGTAGAGGAAGRGGAGQGGTAGAAGRGGQGGTAGAAGRGGASGQGGAAGAAGRGGSGGGSIGCATQPVPITAMPSSPVFNSTCGYNTNPVGGYQHAWTGTEGSYYALVPTQFLLADNACGRCAQFTTGIGTAVTSVTATVVGDCGAQCGNSVMLSPSAYTVLAGPNTPPLLPLVGQTLNWRYVECPVPLATDGQPERIRASIRTGTDVTRANAVKFLGQRYGITSARTTINGAIVDLQRGSDNFWSTPNNALLGPGQATLMLTDTNSRTTDVLISITLNEQITNAQLPICP